ncbi:High-affinity choline uptake protein BetT [Pseudonocardia sp. Ae406_Ps2]|uniref:BCCT family transporter n=1 Tax=unclassified Pseudonocardia TaxID=2619320 RepID=UPI000964756B|nr:MULTISPECIES: BCCT family transporter [unclassified Pseudonocardia]OLM01759.1 High-affinity choline uptake protein BetT [Pseudonocardia sp. Ae406_Ps2]OLM06459.1 High-affinity choline uptake protein BetT [Pseudonocardia sp. Ae331_Ps2]OLM13197.1 High-affinity choline uptake protein BetT [Pseudonocardia sp. Ae505_Ps2]OLM23329.1 High-affinity choline uptake protein BetT [Pseudonocardia sp. Ae706_Ps2]
MTQAQSPPDDRPGTTGDGRPRTDWIVFGVGAALALLFVLWGLLSADTLGATAEAMLGGLMRGGGWGFILAATAFVAFALFLAFSRFGRIKLGADDEEPEFRTVSWIAMMFSAGMGIGLMFFGVNEPLTFFRSPPPGSAEPGTVDALQTSMATSLFHWTLHPWAIYAVVGLAIAYSTFRKGRRQLISQAFVPLIGRKAAEGSIGRAIDILAIFATLFGSAASLGLGAFQIGGGMQTVGWVDGPVSPWLLAAIIVVLTAAFILSAVSGVEKGIQWLSNTNMVLAAVLAFFVFVVGPTVIILDLIPTSIGAYFSQFFEMVGRTEAVGGEPMLEWLSGWTIFYWAWWISWTPFVGMFLARISRGRTIREFVGGVILAPSLVSLVWFCIFGGTAITQAQQGTQFSDDSNVQLFQMLAAYPWATFTGLLVMVLVAIFFVSGADAASIVMGTLSQRGTIEPTKWVVVFWGSVMGAVAVLMLVTGGENALDGIQNLTILVAAPFVVIMVLLCFALFKDLRRDKVVLRDEKGAQVLEQAVDWATVNHGEHFYVKVGAFDPDDENAPGSGNGNGAVATGTDGPDGSTGDGSTRATAERRDSPVGGD